MPYKEERPKQKKEIRIYSDPELKEFDTELNQNFRVSHTLRNGEVVSIIDTIKYHKSQNSMNPDGAIYINKDPFGEIQYPIKYETIEEKLRQWGSWKSRQEYGQKKRLEGLDELAKSMRINPEGL